MFQYVCESVPGPCDPARCLPAPRLPPQHRRYPGVMPCPVSVLLRQVRNVCYLFECLHESLDLCPFLTDRSVLFAHRI